MNARLRSEEAGPASRLAQHAAGAALVASGLAVTALALLHVVSPEFDPSWRMVSEYANGRYGWLLTLFFGAWAVSSWAIRVFLVVRH